MVVITRIFVIFADNRNK